MAQLPPYDPSKEKQGGKYFPTEAWTPCRITDVKIDQAESGDEMWEVTFKADTGEETGQRFYLGEKSVWKFQKFISQTQVKTIQELQAGTEIMPQHLRGWRGELKISKGKEKPNSPGKHYWNLDARLAQGGSNGYNEGGATNPEDIPF